MCDADQAYSYNPQKRWGCLGKEGHPRQSGEEAVGALVCTPRLVLMIAILKCPILPSLRRPF